MIKDFFSNYGLYIYAVFAVLLVAIVLIIIFKKPKKKELEDTSSILDVNIDGVVDKDFNYGYSKEETTVMKPIRKEKNKKKK